MTGGVTGGVTGDVTQRVMLGVMLRVMPGVTPVETCDAPCENYNAFLAEAIRTYDIARDEPRDVYREPLELSVTEPAATSAGSLPTPQAGERRPVPRGLRHPHKCGIIAACAHGTGVNRF